jgi:glyoxylase-like metal-dependent hydrolase (beta-lactamase superfamily II)
MKEYPKIHRYTTHDMKMIVNVFLVETQDSVVAVDAATALSSSREIREIIDNKIGKPLKAVLLTHGHPDHYIGAGELRRGLNIPIVSTQGTLEFARYQDEYKIHTLRKGYGDNFPEKRVFPDTLVRDGDVVTIDKIDFKVKDLGPCESDSDSIWVIAVEGIEHVFAGDVVYNRRHSYLRDGHALKWLKHLDEMLDTYDHTTVIHPGHGDDCGCEGIFWQKAYIQAFLYMLRSMLGDKQMLTGEEQAAFFNHMTSFLPDETILFLLKYEPEETIKALKKENAV